MNAQLQKARRRRQLAPLLTLTGANDARETFYQNMLHEAARGLKLDLPPLYPVGWAANYSLLYTLLRAVTETPVERVLEIGAGVSSLLLDSVAKTNPGLYIETLETDLDWATRIRTRVAHTVHHVVLEPMSIHGRQSQGFASPPSGKFDLVLVDAPNGTPTHSRWAALSALDKVLEDEYLVIFDDAERDGEQMTIAEFMRGRDAKMRVVQSNKAQCLIYTPRFRSAAFF